MRTTPVINQIETLVKDIPGWSPIDQLYTLFNLAYMTSDLPGDIMEVGSWCGRSTVVLGTAARLTGNSRIVCVDLFPEKNDWRQNADGSYSFTVEIEGKIYGGYQDQTVWKEPFERDIAPLFERHNGIKEIFDESVAKHGLQGLVTAFRGNSALFRKNVKPGFRCKVAFLDGDHSYDAVCEDIRNADDFLVPGGWICFDDAFSYYDGVNRAIEDLIIANPRYELAQQMTRKFFVARKRKA